jgi:hypothetical protein
VRAPRDPVVSAALTFAPIPTSVAPAAAISPAAKAAVEREFDSLDREEESPPRERPINSITPDHRKYHQKTRFLAADKEEDKKYLFLPPRAFASARGPGDLDFGAGAPARASAFRAAGGDVEGNCFGGGLSVLRLLAAFVGVG